MLLAGDKMMFYEFSKYELLMKKVLSNIWNVQLIMWWTEKTKQGILLLLFFQIDGDYLTIPKFYTWIFLPEKK